MICPPPIEVGAGERSEAKSGLVERKGALDEDPAHHRADLSRRSDHCDPHGECYEVTPAQPKRRAGGGLQSRPKAVCSAPTASSTTESRTQHEMRIDEVEII